MQQSLNQLSEAEADALLHDWSFIGRPDQQAPAGEWLYWLLKAGRGFGKTRTGAEWIRERVKRGYGRLALVAPTAGDARDTMIEGESGLLAISWAGDYTDKGHHMGIPEYEPSKKRLTWANGARCAIFSAEEPERLRGPQHDSGWCDELAAWQYMQECWDMFVFGLRLGDNPQAVITTTPKPRKMLKELMLDPDCITTHGSTYDNAANLAPQFLKKLKDKYEGTRTGRQELLAEYLEEAEGALWSRELIETNRIDPRHLPDMKRVVIAIDPASTSKETSDETGLVACGFGMDNKGYVLEDATGRYTPDGWAKKAIAMYHDHHADRIVAEANNGGEMVEATVRNVRDSADKPLGRTIPYRSVWAQKNKRARAEPVSALSERGLIKFAGKFTLLEDELVGWEPMSGMESPNRLDAVVWGFTDLMLGPNVEQQDWAKPVSTGGGNFTHGTQG